MMKVHSMILLHVLLAQSSFSLSKTLHQACSRRSSSLHGLQMVHFSHDGEGCSTNRAFGYAIGRQFKSEIAARVRLLGPQLQKAIEFTSTAEGRAANESLVRATAKRYPQYWEELEGIIEGSEIPRELIILLNFRQELSILADAAVKHKGVDDCSDLMVANSDHTAYLGHNEDNSYDTVNTSYFVQATLNGRSWTAFTYAGELSTAAWGFNDAGISFTLNAVYANRVQTGGVGRTFVSRSILDAPDLESAIERVQAPDQATGHNINLISLDDRAIVSIETAPGNLSSIKRISDEAYFHANAYLRLNVSQSPGPSSKHREERAADFKTPKSREDILKILGDTEDPAFPIWRSGSDKEYTLCTAFFDLQAETVEVIFDNPKKGLNNDPNNVRFQLRKQQSLSDQ